jgi:hypothetical protein
MGDLPTNTLTYEQYWLLRGIATSPIFNLNPIAFERAVEDQLRACSAPVTDADLNATIWLVLGTDNKCARHTVEPTPPPDEDFSDCA